jgi:hypothetical protein
LLGEAERIPDGHLRRADPIHPSWSAEHLVSTRHDVTLRDTIGHELRRSEAVHAVFERNPIDLAPRLECEVDHGAFSVVELFRVDASPEYEPWPRHPDIQGAAAHGDDEEHGESE